MRYVLVLVSAVVSVLGVPAGVWATEPVDLTGVWNAEGGGTYYLRQIGKEVWWYGEESVSEPGWANVAHGSLAKGELHLRWVDVPKGGAGSEGDLVLRLVSPNRLEVVKETGGFTTTVLTRA